MPGNRVRVVLASSSPRRQDLMTLLGIVFEVEPAGVEETDLPGESPGELAQRLAVDKALAVSRRRPEAVVIGADTIVVLDGRVLGKPESPEEARGMLEALSGRTHSVITGVAVVRGGRILAAHEVTEVDFDVLSPREIHAYVDTKEPMDKAGGYAIQGKGSVLIRGIRGCYFNVVGLPLRRLSKMLAEFDLRVI